MQQFTILERLVNVATPMRWPQKGWDFYNDIKSLEILMFVYFEVALSSDIYEEIFKIGNFPLLIRPFINSH